MLYTKNFKKQVVKKVLSPGVLITEVCRKLNISISSVHSWKKLYADEVRNEIKEIDVNAILTEKEVDIEEFLRQSEQKELAEKLKSKEVELSVDEIFQKGKNHDQYSMLEKYSIVATAKTFDNEKLGIFLRKYGYQSRQIKLWEEELLAMGKKNINNDEYIKKLEEENKKLKKELKNTERDNRELKILIELKKKYHNLFKDNEEE